MAFEIDFRRILPDGPRQQVETLSEMARFTFSHTFRHYDPADLHDYLDSSLSVEALEAELDDEKNFFYFVRLNGETAGYLKWISPSREYLEHTTLDPKLAVLLQRFYFLPHFCGVGLAPVALEFVKSFARHHAGAELLYLSVWEKNYRAQRFYQKHGFRTLGSFGYPVGRVIDVEFLYGYALC